MLAGGPLEVGGGRVLVTASKQKPPSVPSTELSLHYVASSQTFAGQTRSRCHKALRFVSSAHNGMIYHITPVLHDHISLCSDLEEEI